MKVEDTLELTFPLHTEWSKRVRAKLVISLYLRFCMRAPVGSARSYPLGLRDRAVHLLDAGISDDIKGEIIYSYLWTAVVGG